MGNLFAKDNQRIGLIHADPEAGRAANEVHRGTNDDDGSDREELVGTLTNSLDTISAENDVLKNELQKSREENDSLRLWISTELENLNSTVERKEQENQQLLLRLSEVAGTKLVDDNPNVTDLSDDNRATKLAEQYSELYDNEWTDTYSTLTETHNYSEEEAISKILCLVEKIFQCVSNQAVESWRKINESICEYLFTPPRKGDTNVKTVQKHLKDLRKQKAKFAVPNIIDNVDEWLSSDSEVKDVYCIVKDSDFFTKCVELFWKMVIQDPPLSLSFRRKAGKKYKTDFYRPYTAGGKKIEYVVWPVLYLHKKGPLLCKGIAQGTDSKLTEHSDVRKLKKKQNDAVSRPGLTVENELEHMPQSPGTHSTDKYRVQNIYSHQTKSEKTGFLPGQTIHRDASSSSEKEHTSNGHNRMELATASKAKKQGQVEPMSPSHGQNPNPMNAWNVSPQQTQQNKQAAKTWHGTTFVTPLVDGQFFASQHSTDGNVTFDPK